MIQVEQGELPALGLMVCEITIKRSELGHWEQVQNLMLSSFVERTPRGTSMEMLEPRMHRWAFDRLATLQGHAFYLIEGAYFVFVPLHPTTVRAVGCAAPLGQARRFDG